MLINVDQVIAACSLSKEVLEKVLDESGYYPMGIKSATFVGMNDNSTFVHQITYQGDDGQDETGNVYVSYLEADDGSRILRAEF